MSWSLVLKGMPQLVRAEAATRLAAIKCPEPEEQIKNAVAAIIDATLAVYPPDQPIALEAAGHQYSPSNPEGGAPFHMNNVVLKLEPIYGFLV